MKLLQRALALVATAVALVAAPAARAGAQAAKTPNLSGTWELDVQASSFGMMPGPQKATMVLTHADPSLKQVTTSVGPQGEQKDEIALTTDGKEIKRTLRGTEATTVLKWEGSVLTNTTRLTLQGNDITVVEKWGLSEDGKVLTITAAISTPMGQLDQTRIYNKR